MTFRGTVTALLTAFWIAFPGAAPAQMGLDADASYKDQLNACLNKEDYPCALDVLITHGRNSGNPKVAVSIQRGPTLLGAQMFAVLDLAQGNVPPETFHEMAQAALNYALDAEPASSIAAGPFILQAAEACLAIEDINCLRTAVQPLQILMSMQQFYIKGNASATDKPDVNTRVVNLIKAYNEMTR